MIERIFNSEYMNIGSAASTIEQVEKFCETLKHFFIAVSCGHESLIIPHCAGIKRDAFDAINNEHRMIRMYVGLENAKTWTQLLPPLIKQVLLRKICHRNVSHLMLSVIFVI